jgi:hypothetical protein
MTRLRCGLGVGLAWVALTGTLPAAPPAPDVPNTPAALAALIDRRIQEGYTENKVTPAPLTDDATFLRRVYLDLTGKVPPVTEVYRFLGSKDPDKRARLVDDLLHTAGYVGNSTAAWRAILLPQTNQQAQFFAQQMDAWVRERVREDMPYDRMVRELLTASVSGQFNPAQPGSAQDFNARVFYQANEFKAENIASSVSRLFLGVKLECAQCHDHPFDQWKKPQFWEFAAFFASVQPQGRGANAAFQPGVEQNKVREIAIPGGDKKAQARFLDGSDPKWTDDASPRQILADWVTSKDNPYFAKAAVNRLWAHFFGIGLVDPVDEFSAANAPSHPELLDELAAAFVRSNYDVKFITRAILASKSYQRSSEQTDESQEDLRLFGRMPLKGLTAEQLFDSLSQATGFRDGQQGVVNPGFPQQGNVRAEFLNRFANAVDKKTEHQTSILQALAMMNGRFIADVTSIERSQTLVAILDSPFSTNEQRLNTLYLAALARSMRTEEAAKLVPYVNEGGPTKDPRRALADVFWVLLNSSEFCLNH